MESQKATEQIAYPVFYDVDPSEVRKQLGPVGEAFARHNNRAEVGMWREAMAEVANLAGWDLRNTDDGHEAKLIKKIVAHISLELRVTNTQVDERLIGMESRIKDIVSSLEMGVEDVRMIGIKGIGGGGKTTLAKAVFDKICFSFEGRIFIENVREVSTPSMSGLRLLHEQVLSSVLNEGSFTVGSVHEGKDLMKKRLFSKKVILVLDDVDHLDQLDALAGGLNWFKPGSRIIITTRDEQVLVAHRVKLIHDVNLLSQDEAMCLFRRYAFGSDIPIQTYHELSLKVIHYAAGLPLTIKVLGSFLCGKDELEWEDAIERLRTIPLKETQEKLELSYTGLEDDYREIFLDVACLLKGWVKEDAIRALESCGCHARNGLRVLEQKSLITISSRYQQLGMHDHIQEMGLNIVRRSHPGDRIRHSRLWIRREIEDLLADDVFAVHTISRHVKRNLCSKIFTNVFGNVTKLRFLQVDSNTTSWHMKRLQEIQSCNELRYLEELQPGNELQSLNKSEPLDELLSLNKLQPLNELPYPQKLQPLIELLSMNTLRSLSLQRFPSSCLPKTFQGNNLATLAMPYGRTEQLWEEGERTVLTNLNILGLSHSELTTLHCGSFPNLKKLNLEYSFNLAELDVPTGCLRRLVYLDLNHCIGFKSFSFIKQLESLQVLDLSYLYLTEFPDILPGKSNYSLLELNFSTNNFKKLPSSIGDLQNIVYLDFSWCKNLESLPQSICSLKCLKDLDLENCAIQELPEDLGHLESLETLNLSGTRLKHLPAGICMLKHLKTLLLARCKFLKKLPTDLGLLASLEELSLAFCNIREVPSSICKLKHLRELNLFYCEQLENLPEKLGGLEYLEELDVEGTTISHLPQSIYLLKDLKIVGFKSNSQRNMLYNAMRKSLTSIKLYKRCSLHDL